MASQWNTVQLLGWLLSKTKIMQDNAYDTGVKGAGSKGLHSDCRQPFPLLKPWFSQ